MSGRNIIKKTTGLTGLIVCSNPKYMLTRLYAKLVRLLQQMPLESQYSDNDVQEIEDVIQCGQVEELIIQAENEISLARNVLIWKPWEPLLTQPEPNQWKWPPNKN
ncbi:hypothetical protein AAG570_010625 [Ranatra chinensis]|uniref:NADH dehydrogenase [ubiquinone] 1 alpha subcomplex subunit 5 n=1 Tax=Ranatra chinensis TaxID=642074 RepID=A0ABD0Z563_9HEMI